MIKIKNHILQINPLLMNIIEGRTIIKKKVFIISEVYALLFLVFLYF
jgi:hypothetical protein